METKKYISWGQLMLLLFMCRVFTLMTFVPFAEKDVTLSMRIAAAIISTLVQAVLLMPAAVLKSSVTETLLRKNKPVGIIAAALYLTFFILYAVNSLLHFRRFLSARFFPTSDGTVWIFVLLVVCVYCARLGTEALGRSAVLLFVLFMLSLAAMTASSADKAEVANLYFEKIPAKGVVPAVLDDLARSGEICAVMFLAGRTRSKLRCGIYGLLAAKLALTSAAAIMVAAVLGDFAALSEYPFLALGTFGGTKFIQRGDSLYLIVWTITAVINISLFLHISAELFGEVFPKLKYRTAAAAALVFCILLIFTLGNKDFSGVYSLACSGTAVILLAGILPLAALVYPKKKEEKCYEKTA